MQISRLATVVALTLLLASGARGQSLTPAEAEAQGIDLPSAATPEASAPATGGLVVCDDDVLLVPNSTDDGVDILDPATGELVMSNFILDPTNLSTPINAIPNFDGDGILVSDQVNDVVQHYDCTGTYIGVFAPAGGANTAILDNIRGMAYGPTGDELWVTVGGGANDDAIALFDRSGTYLGNLFANGSDGFDSPFDVLVRSQDLLSSTITSDAIYSFDFGGTFNGLFGSPIPFPEQLAVAANGNVLVADFETDAIFEFDPTGSPVGTYSFPTLSGLRGIYELPNGHLLTSNGSGVYEVTRSGTVVNTVVSGKSARFIELFAASSSGVPDVDIEYLGSTEGPQRDDFVFVRAQLTNNETSTVRTRVYAEVLYPNGITRRYSVGSADLPAGASLQIQKIKRIKLPIPADAPAGTYTATLFAADDIAAGGQVYDTDSFTFDLDAIHTTKQASGADVGPNPFTTETTLRYELAADAVVDLRVYDVTGREVASLISGVQAAGVQSATLEAGDLPSGVYVWRLSIDGEVQTGRVTLTR